MTLPRFAVAQCGCMVEEYQCSRKLWSRHYYLWLFLQVALSHTPPLRVLEVHIKVIRGITIHITESKIRTSNSENHDRRYFSIIFTWHPFQSSRIPLLRVVLFWSVLFLMLQNCKKKIVLCPIDWQLSIPNINGYAYWYPLPPLWRSELNLDLDGIKRGIIHLIVPKNYGFDTIISEYFYKSPFLFGC